jgi:hypothetical protein
MSHFLEDALELNSPDRSGFGGRGADDVSSEAGRMSTLECIGAFNTNIQRTPLESEPSRTYEGFRLVNLQSADTALLNVSYARAPLSPAGRIKFSDDPKYSEMQSYCKKTWEVVNGTSQLGIGAINQSEVSFCSLLMKHIKRLPKLTEEQYTKRLPELYKWYQQETDRMRKNRDKLQLRQRDVKAAQLGVGTVVYVWTAYSKPGTCSGWYQGTVKADNGDGTYDILLERGDRQQKVPRKWIRADSKLVDKQRQNKSQATKRQKMRELGEERRDARKEALLECQEPKYDHVRTLVGLEQSMGAVDFDESTTTVSADKAAWSLLTSVWAPRLKEADSRDFYDNPKVKSDGFAADWARSKLGRAGQKMVPPDQVPALMMLLGQHFPLICDIVVNYGAFTPMSPFSISWNGFRHFLHETKIVADGMEGEEALVRVYNFARNRVTPNA